MNVDPVVQFGRATGTRMLLVRHAHVATTRLCGSTDVALSPEGEAQVAALRQRVHARVAPPALYASPLQRAAAVARALATSWGMAWQAAPAIAEIDCGAMEGLPIAEIERCWPQVWQRNAAQVDDGFRWPGGESYAEFRTRVLAGLSTIADAQPAGLSVVITHAGVVSQVLGALDGRPAAIWDADRPSHLAGAGLWWADGAPRAVSFVNAPDWWRALRRRAG